MPILVEVTTNAKSLTSDYFMMRNCHINPFNEKLPTFESIDFMVKDIVQVCNSTTGIIDMMELHLYGPKRTSSDCLFPGRDRDTGIFPMEISEINDKTKAELTSVLIDMIRKCMEEYSNEERLNTDIREYCVRLLHDENDLFKKIVIHCMNSMRGEII